MLVDCPICTKSYHVSRSELSGGRTLICPRCDACWSVDENGATDLPSASLRAAKPAAATFTYARPDTPGSLLAGTRTILAGAAILGLLMMAIGARERIVRAMPRLASVYTIAGLPVVARGLEFMDLTPARLEADPSRLAVSGAIRNVATRGMAPPRIVYELSDAAGLPMSTWTEAAPGGIIRAGGKVVFASSPHIVPPEARTIRVSFEDTHGPGRHGPALSLAATLLH